MSRDLYYNTKDKKDISGNYWAMNSYLRDKGSSVQSNNEFYIKEKLTNKLDVKPVIVLLKY